MEMTPGQWAEIAGSRQLVRVFSVIRTKDYKVDLRVVQGYYDGAKMIYPATRLFPVSSEAQRKLELWWDAEFFQDV